MSEREAQAIADAVMHRVLDKFDRVTTSVRRFNVNVSNARAKAQQELSRLRDSIIKDAIARLRLGKSPEAIVEELTQAYAREALRGPIMDVAMALAQSLIRRRVAKELATYILTLFTELVRGRLGIELPPPQAPAPAGRGVVGGAVGRAAATTIIYGRRTPFETALRVFGCRAWLTEYGIEYSCPDMQFVNQLTNAWGMPCVRGGRLCDNTVRAINWGLGALDLPILNPSNPPTLDEAKQLARQLMDEITKRGLQTYQWGQYYDYLRLLLKLTP